MTVHIITDSSCDLPNEVATGLNINIVPLSIRFGNDEFVDRRDLTTEQFWQRCQGSDTLPETAAPSPGAFEQAYRSAMDANATAVIVITISSDLSATMEAALSAARAVGPEVDIRVIDSRTVSLGLGNLARQAAEAARTGADAQTIEDAVRESLQRTRVHAALDTLDNLKKGGRIGAAQSLLGSLLSIKPLIEVRDGIVVPAGKQRTRTRALNHLIELVSSQDSTIQNLAVLHAACDDVDQLVSALAPLVDHEILVGQVGPVVGSHAGIGTIGVTFQLGD